MIIQKCACFSEESIFCFLWCKHWAITALFEMFMLSLPTLLHNDKSGLFRTQSSTQCTETNHKINYRTGKHCFYAPWANCSVQNVVGSLTVTALLPLAGSRTDYNIGVLWGPDVACTCRTGCLALPCWPGIYFLSTFCLNGFCLFPAICHMICYCLFWFYWCLQKNHCYFL